MLSTEIPPVLDPSCNLDSDDKNQQQVEELVDLQLDDESGFDDNNINSLPSFSIRDYVFNTRSKDIQINWPFSQKNLQLCLKHGLKDVLPPFQSLNSVKTLSILKNAVENTSTNVKFSSRNVGEKLAVNIEKNIISSESKNIESLSTSTVELKKCRLIVKSNQETMASKACPVCKAFSSSSNTTLNAHIDQCLSGESTVKWTANSKVVKHRIKPRKIRLMEDIYSTALHCTLEDLDRRNGTSWASNSEVRAEEKRKKECSLNIEENNEEGDVYIDASGTKVRILSKFSEPPSTSNAADDCGPRKLMKKDKGLLSSKRKKYLFEKNKPDHFPEVNNGKQREIPPQEDSEDEDPTYDLGTIKRWVGSKRSGLKKKMNLEDQNTKNLSLNGTSDSIPPILCDENLYLRKRRETVSLNSHNECDEEPSPRKRVGFPLLRSQDFHGNKNHLNKLTKDGPLVRGRSMDSPNGTDNHVFSWSSKNLSSPRKTSLNHEISPSGKKFSSLRKDLLSGKHASVPESENNPGRKSLDFKRRKLLNVLGSDEEAGPSRFAKVAAARMEKCSGELSSSRVLRIRKKKRGFIGTSETTFEPDSHDTDKNIDSLVNDNVPVGTSRIQDITKENEIRDEFIGDPISKSADEEAFITFSRPLDSVFFAAKVGDDFVSDTQVAAEIGGSEGGNYFVDDDLIPIPGPPGSFLPSPGRMGSEEPHGTSSLTTCRIQSSEDEHEHGCLDMDSSDSPISTTSMVSNTARSHPVSFINPSMQFHAVQKTLSGVSEEAGVESKGSFDKLSQSSSLNNHESHSRQQNFSEARFPTCGDCESPSNPVLRLMGKNLMVLSKDENPSPRIQTSMVNSIPGYVESVQINDQYHSFHHHSSSRAPSIFDCMQTGMPAQHVNLSSSHTFRIPANSGTGGCNLTLPGQFGSFVELDNSYMKSGNERIFPANVSQLRRPAEFSGNNKHKEIIIIDDDLQEDELDMVDKITHCAEAGRSGYCSRSVNPFYGYQTLGYPIPGGNRMVQNGNMVAPPNSNLFQWNCIPEGSSVMHSAPSQTTGHLRSSLHYPPRLL